MDFFSSAAEIGRVWKKISCGVKFVSPAKPALNVRRDSYKAARSESLASLESIFLRRAAVRQNWFDWFPFSLHPCLWAKKSRVALFSLTWRSSVWAFYAISVIDTVKFFLNNISETFSLSTSSWFFKAVSIFNMSQALWHCYCLLLVLPNNSVFFLDQFLLNL